MSLTDGAILALIVLAGLLIKYIVNRKKQTMVALDIGNKTFDLVENWADVVKLNKYLDVVRINYTNTDEIQARMQILHKVCGIDGRALGDALGAATPGKRKDLAAQMNEWVAVQVMEEVFPVLDFIFTPELLTENPLPVIKHKGISYYGPDEKLATQTGAEMEECIWAHSEYLKTGEEKYLDNLIAAMYRPKRFYWFGDKRKFSKQLAEEGTTTFADMDPIVKRGILLFYQMCEKWWKDNYEFLYDGEPDSADEIDSHSASRLVRMLAGDKRGTVDAVRQMERQEIFFELAELERQRQESEK